MLAFAVLRGVQAQTLPRLAVLSFAMRADTRTPHVGQPFHLEISGRLKEQLSGVDFVVLPNLAGLEPLGDERRAIATSGGTNFSETLTVMANRAGTIHLGGAYFDAIDARDGKAKRYYSNELILNVVGVAPVSNDASPLRAFLMKLVGALLIVFLVGAVLFRKKAQPAQVPIIAAPPESHREAPPIEDSLATALERLKHERDRSAVMSLRHELWKEAGARGGETLNDLISHNGVSGAMPASLRLIERAAFIADNRLAEAIDDAIAAVEKQLA